MAVLKVDLDVLQATIDTYHNELANLNAAKSAIKKSLAALKSSGWDSGASQVWFSLLDDEWLKNIDYQIRVLTRLMDNLILAKDEYYEVYMQQLTLGKSL